MGFPDGELDLATLGQRIRHTRKSKGMTLGELATTVDRAPSLLSQIENGKREPRLTLIQSLASALGVDVAHLIKPEAPSHRAALEIALARAQESPLYATLGLPHVGLTSKLPTDALEALVGLHSELERRATEQAATPEEARRANAELRQQMRDRNNYFTELERTAASLSEAIGHSSGPLTERGINDLTSHLGFTLHRAADLPRATRSITDLRNRRIYLPMPSHTSHDPRTIVLQTLAHFALGHQEPANYADFLRQRVEVNYVAAALLMPEVAAVDFLQRAKAAKTLAIEDLRDVFAVSYEMAAHRFTNLATHHLDIPVHFMRVGEDGIIYKAYENDDVTFPADVTGAIEGQMVCRYWAARAVFHAADRYASHYQYTDMGRGTYWCTTHVERTTAGDFAIDVGVPYAHAKWFQGRETTNRATSACPDPSCCHRPPVNLAERWSEYAWPSARTHSHLLAALPPGTFPGVDDTDVYTFLDRHSPSLSE
ncbi:XRE family transcriptional regulator [Actinobacteria bacterium YIM 96077]|uniref:XRE family transcriptional regulator n=1 Tax=Phytoactinopolyspora halophila TaxID=1981511 RepID=A0A329QER3_9ACTN|nr:helix-turn-helix transcriptional regulator [Phytoactinopolyspora halophila]AYY14048.1 XRE family transcriptional regulator [Actinobacteria bacterium YIM 96077]RAW10955.1 XRE family transcriptional regulator [Phytoactinopolyspora halophila]